MRAVSRSFPAGDFALIVLPVATLLVTLVMALGVRRSRAAGSFDPFHPMIFPVFYVALACIAPTWWLWTSHSLGVGEGTGLAESTPMLMALSSIGFALGSSLRFGPGSPQPTGWFSVPKRIAVAGRLLLVLPIGLAAYDVASGKVATRGLAQNSITLLDSLSVFADTAAIAALVLILASQQMRHLGLLAKCDWLVFGVLIGLLGLSGERGTAIVFMLAILIFMARERAGGIKTVVGLLVAVLFATTVVSYRMAAVGDARGLPKILTVLGDLSSVSFTTGRTAEVLGNQTLGGATLWAGIIRQLPGPIVNRLIGLPSDTGAFRFRQITGLTNDTQGYGFSLPAEGVMNWGAVGSFAVPFVLGVILAAAYGRFVNYPSRARALLYPVMVASLPIAFRSDFLGAIKDNLYPMIIIFVVLVIARSRAKPTPVEMITTATEPHSNPAIPKIFLKPLR